MKKKILKNQELFGVLFGLIIVGFLFFGSLIFKNHFIENKLRDNSEILKNKIISGLDFLLEFHNIKCYGVLSTSCDISNVFLYTKDGQVVSSINKIVINNINNMASIVGFSAKEFEQGKIDLLLNDIKVVSDINPIIYSLFNNSSISIEGQFVKDNSEYIKELDISSFDIKKEKSVFHIETSTYFDTTTGADFFDYFKIKKLKINLKDYSPNHFKVFQDIFVNNNNFQEYSIKTNTNTTLEIELFNNKLILFKDFYSNLFNLKY